MAYKHYSDARVAEVLYTLYVNHYDYEKTAKETGVHIKTIRRWDKDAPKKDIGELLDRAIQRLLSAVPTQFGRGDAWAITLGILLDKWLLMQGQPTARTETIAREIANLTQDERDELITEARTIIERVKSRVAGSGSVAARK